VLSTAGGGILHGFILRQSKKVILAIGMLYMPESQLYQRVSVDSETS
jgi:hypothetical protein